MAQKSGFFNALYVDEEYDRKYNANDYSDNLAVVISNGVLRSENDDLKVSASRMKVSVNQGRAWIDGHYYYNDSTFEFPTTPATVGGKRYDRVVLRLDNNLIARKISLVYIQGEESASPVKPQPIRNDKVYDLVLADVFIDENASSVQVIDTRADADICGWVYSVNGDGSFFQSLDNSFMEWFEDKKDTLSSVTIFKKYNWSKTLTTQTTTVAFEIPQYDIDTCFLEIYINGIMERNYTISNNVITFIGLPLVAGTEVSVNCYKSIDGTGIMNVADEITQLQNQMAQIIGSNKFIYTCSGVDDNIALSEIAQAIYSGSYESGTLTEQAENFLLALGGNEYLTEIPYDGQIKIEVVGNLGASSPYSGSGTATNQYKWFDLSSTSKKHIILDFENCHRIHISCQANTYNSIFNGSSNRNYENLDLRNANCNIGAYNNGANCHITLVKAAKANCENLNVILSTTGNAVIAEAGDFRNCNLQVESTTGTAFCFDVKSANLLRVWGGRYVTMAPSYSACINIAPGETYAVAIANGINVVGLGMYTQYVAGTSAGKTYINGLVSPLEFIGDEEYREVVGHIKLSKV